MTPIEQMTRDYNREQNYRTALAFDVDADLIEVLCNGDGDDDIDDYVMRETLIATGWAIRNQIPFSVVCDIVCEAYNYVVNSMDS